MDRAELLRFARAGAAARLAELDQERQTLLRQFPGLKSTRPAQNGHSSPPADDAPGRRQRRRMSAADRKAVGERMRKYWAERRGNADGRASADGSNKKTAHKDRVTPAGRSGPQKKSAAARTRIGDAQKAKVKGTKGKAA